MTLTAGTRLGPYEILSPLGAGGMGEVYRARDSRLGRDVAVKVLPEDVSANRNRVSRFEQEARSASALNHPNIITIHEVGQAGDVFYIAMELVDGRTLRELCASEPLPFRRAIGLAVQIAEGLAKAHAAGIVHRDLKPENLMVSKDGFVKILDFGLAKLTDAEPGQQSAAPTLARPETHPGTVMGTVGYMSPEQASGRPVDYRSDQFSLGSILYETVSGMKAFERKTAAETMSAIIRDEPEPLVKLRPDVAAPLRWIIERCLAKDPEERYASTRDLARELAGVRDHISEISGGMEASDVSKRTGVRRRRLSPLVGGFGTAVLAAGIAAGIAAGVLATKALSKPAVQAPLFRRITFRRGEIANARFAPDGKTVVYGARWAGEPARLFLTRSDSPESRPFDFRLADILAVSPSGEMAILLGNVPAGVLARAPLSGGAAREVLDGVLYASADWAPDGKEMVIAHEVAGRARLEYPIGKPIVESAGEDFGVPRFSAAGDRIAFYGSDDLGNMTLNVARSSGKERRALWSGTIQFAGAPCWTPDDREIWVTPNETGASPGLYAVDLAGHRRLVARIPGSLELDDISRDGRVLAAHHTLIQVLNGLIGGEQKERDLSWLDGSFAADLSEDGKTLVFTEAAEGSGGWPEVYMRPTDGSPAVRLGEGRALALSPDGKSVLASVRSKDGRSEHLVLLPTGIGETKTFKDDAIESYAGGGGGSGGGAGWLPDGKRIVFAGTDKRHKLRIHVHDIETGVSRPITPEDTPTRLASKPVSPDGKLVIGIHSPGKASLYPVDGGKEIPVVGLLAGEIPVQWSSDARLLYVRSRDDVPSKVSLLDPATGARRLWREISPPESPNSIGRLLITRDGRSYVYGFQRALSELYLIEGLR